MAVFRVEKNGGYTVMSNYHLRDSRLSLKAKGLLSQMLSLPDGWDYTMTGLSKINRENKDAIRSAVNELEAAGYIVRHQTTDGNGKFAGNEYIIREQPSSCAPLLENPSTENPATENPSTENPSTENPPTENPSTGNPSTGNPSTENPTQLNKDISSKDISEKKSEKEKPGRKPKEAVDPLPLFVEWIDKRFPDHLPHRKNALYQALARFAQNRVAIKRPLQSQSAVTALCNRLLRITSDSRDPLHMMIDLLDIATSSGWQSVYPPKSGPPQKTAQKSSGGRVYEEL